MEITCVPVCCRIPAILHPGIITDMSLTTRAPRHVPLFLAHFFHCENEENHVEQRYDHQRYR